jgi:uncharacterized iron-regulated membrane protein
VLWRDLHAVTGFWGAALLLVMLLSGMTWTGFWGKQYAEVWNVFPAAMWNDVPKSDVEAGSSTTPRARPCPGRWKTRRCRCPATMPSTWPTAACNTARGARDQPARRAEHRH